MCLGSIGRVIALHDGGAATVDADGRHQRALNLTPGQVPLVAGDWVVLHSGFILGTLTEPEALDALSIRHAPHQAPRHGLRPLPDPEPTPQHRARAERTPQPDHTPQEVQP